MYFSDPLEYHITTYADACPDCCHSLMENDEKVYTLSTESAGKLLGLTGEKLLLSLPSQTPKDSFTLSRALCYLHLANVYL